jgi:hypothetical protein
MDTTDTIDIIDTATPRQIAARKAARTRRIRRAAKAARKALRRAVRGNYQERLLTGQQNWSGSDLRGRAAKWGGKYAQSRYKLCARASRILGMEIAIGLVLIDGRWNCRPVVQLPDGTWTGVFPADEGKPVRL